MAEIRGTFVFPDGLTPGQSSSGGMSQLLFDSSGTLRDHGTFFPDGDAGSSGSGSGMGSASGRSGGTASAQDTAQLIGLIIGIGFVIAEVVASSPPVQRWWRDRVIPTVRRWFRRAPRAAANTGRTPPLAIAAAAVPLTSVVSADEVTPVEFSREVEAVIAESGQWMSTEEAQRRLVAMLAAAAFIADQLRALSAARIEDEDPNEDREQLPPLRQALAQLSTEQVTDAVNRMLEANTSLIDERTSEAFLEVFGGGAVVEGVYVPLATDRVRDALRLPEFGLEARPETEAPDLTDLTELPDTGDVPAPPDPEKA